MTHVMKESWEILSRKKAGGYVIVTSINRNYVCTVELGNDDDSLERSVDIASAHNAALRIEYELRSLMKIIKGGDG